jgi:hypothetical protein
MSDPVTYTAVLPVAEETVLFVLALLAAERCRRGTRSRRRALGCYRQAVLVLVLRWFVDGTRLSQLAADHRIGRSTATRAQAERGNSLLKTTFKALHRVSLCPWRIDAITAAASSCSTTNTAAHMISNTGGAVTGNGSVSRLGRTAWTQVSSR